MKILLKKRLLLVLLISACQPSKQEKCSLMENSIRKYYEDAAFKNNKVLKIYDLKTTDYEMVGEGRIDTLTMLRLGKMRDAFYNQFLANKDVAESHIRLVKLKKELDGYVPEYEKEELDKNLSSLKTSRDSMNHYIYLDSLVTNKIKSRKSDPKIYYYAKTFTKLTLDGKNELDTLYYILDKDYKLITH